MSTRASDVAFAVTLSAALTWYNNVAGRHPVHRRWYPLANLAAAGLTLTAASASGLTADDLGLSRARLLPGLRLGAAAAAPVLAAYGAAAAVPASRPLLGDQRVTTLSTRQLAYHVLIRIPLGTVAWEEVAFRSVLDAALHRVLPPPAATACASLAFGAWHVRPAAEALAGNAVATAPAARIAAVAGVAAGTGAAGALLSALRIRSGSLAAPVMLHAAANCGGALAVALATWLDQRRTSAGRARVRDGAGR